MEIRLQAIAKTKRGAVPESLRKVVVEHLDGGGYDYLRLDGKQKKGRNPGWARLKATPEHAADYRGVLKIEWLAEQRMLVARAETRGQNTPHLLMAAFVHYLMEFHGSRIHSINIQLS